MGGGSSDDDDSSSTLAVCGLFDHETGEQTKTWEQLLTNNIITISDNNSSRITTTSHNDLLNGDLVLPDNIKTIDGWAFQNCTSLTGISLPASIESIGVTAFNGCIKLAKVNFAGTASQWAQISFGSEYSNPTFYSKNLYINGELATDIDLSSATSISNYAFKNCRGLTTVTIGASVASIGKDVFDGAYNISRVNYTGTVNQWAQIQFANYASNPMKSALGLYINDQLVTSAVITSNISQYAFYKCESLTDITIGSEVESIGTYAFNGCKNLNTINYNATNCADVEYNKDIFGSVGTGGTYATLNIGANVTKIPAYIFAKNTVYSSDQYIVNIANINFASGSVCTSIGESAFYGNQVLTSFTIPDSVKIIGNGAFSQCSALASVTIGNGVTELEDYAFSQCKALTSISLPNSVETIGGGAFSDCNELVKVTFGSGLKLIKANAFSGCTKFEQVTFANKNNWKVSPNADLSKGESITIDNSTAIDLRSSNMNHKCNYYWYRQD